MLVCVKECLTNINGLSNTGTNLLDKISSFFSRIEKPYADMRDYVCSSEAWGTMELPTVRHPFQSTSGQIDFSRFPRVHAVGDILIKNKKYRLGVWSNRIFLGKMKQKDSIQIFKVLFETHRCMVEVLENEEDGEEEQIDLVFLRFIEDKSDGNYRNGLNQFLQKKF